MKTLKPYFEVYIVAVAAMSFYVTCNSKNTPFFQDLDLSGFEVSVVDIYIPTGILEAAIDYSFTVSKNGDGEERQTLNVVHLRNFHGLIQVLHDQLDGAAAISITKQGFLVADCSEGVSVALSYPLAKMLGFSVVNLTGKVEATRPIIVDFLHGWVSVQANIIYPYPVNGHYRSVIYQGPPVNHAIHPLYHLAIPTVSSGLQITLRDFEDNCLELEDGAYSLTVHFRKQEHPF